MQIDPLSASSQHIRLKAENAWQQGQNNFKDILAQAEREQDNAKLKQACQEIEAMFVQHMLKQMRATVPKGGLIPESMASKMYQEMLDAEYSKLIASSPHHSLGIADLIYQQLKPQIVGQPNEQTQINEQTDERE
ncbi:MAG: rod-binding protein [Peptococcia bacterium]|jgi:flagellar protein FlgJ